MTLSTQFTRLKKTGLFNCSSLMSIVDKLAPPRGESYQSCADRLKDIYNALTKWKEAGLESTSNNVRFWSSSTSVILQFSGQFVGSWQTIEERLVSTNLGWHWALFSIIDWDNNISYSIFQIMINRLPWAEVKNFPG